MVAPVRFVGPSSGKVAKVTDYGQVVTGRVAFNESAQIKVNTINQAFNLIEPKSNNEIIIDSIVLTANKGVGTNNAVVTLYTTDRLEGLTPARKLFETEMIKNSTITLSGLSLLVDQGYFVNIKTDDNDIFATVFYYFVNKET